MPVTDERAAKIRVLDGTNGTTCIGESKIDLQGLKKGCYWCKVFAGSKYELTAGEVMLALSFR
jgi:hypothetical protein